MKENDIAPHLTPANQKEFLRVFLANEREILRYVMAFVPHAPDAQEIVQQTALVLWEKFHSYDRERPFAPWACRFARHVSLQWIERREKWRKLLDDGLAKELAERREQLQPEFDQRLSHLDACLGKLPDRQRELVEGYYVRQLDARALAEESRRSVEAVYKTLQRVRKHLRECIERARLEANTS
ncbi:MAG: sigma-70 family RNA polymerase sigma factor [Planctomycetota bacterium]